MKIHKNKIGFTSRKGRTTVVGFPKDYMTIFNKDGKSSIYLKRDEEYENYEVELKTSPGGYWIENWSYTT